MVFVVNVSLENLKKGEKNYSLLISDIVLIYELVYKVMTAKISSKFDGISY